MEYYIKKELFYLKNFAEIGFGVGITLRRMSKYFQNCYGLDISEQNIELTKLEIENEDYNNIKLIQHDILVYNKEYVSKFDLITYIHGIEHFSEKDNKNIIFS